MDKGESPSASGLFASLRGWLATTLELAQVRLALLGTELEREKLRLFDALLWLGLGLLFMGIGLVLVSAFIVVLFWESHRLVALGVLAVLHLGGGLGLFFAGRKRLQVPGSLFRASLVELARDRAGLDDPD